MERKSKQELIAHIEEQNKNLLKYKSRLHDIVESYKHLLEEKETLETSIKSLIYVENITGSPTDGMSVTSHPEKVNDDSLQKLKSSLEALTVKKARIENEFRTDRKKLLAEKEELEKTLVEKENKWSVEKERYESLVQDLKKKISSQQHEREKEQQDHALMLKELQNLLAVERTNKEKYEEQFNEMHHKVNSKLSEKKVIDYEKNIEELQNKLKISNNKLQSAENLSKKHLILLHNVQQEMDDLKSRYQKKLDEETKRANDAEEKLNMLIIVKEKRIANLEARISDLSGIIGSNDKIIQKHVLTIQKLKGKIIQLQMEHCSLDKVIDNDKFLECKQTNIDRESNQDITLQATSEAENLLNCDEKQENQSMKNVNVQCQISQLKEELKMAKAEAVMKEKHSKSSHNTSLSKEVKELKSQVSQLQDLLCASRSQLKLNEEYYNKITANLEKSIKELKALHKEEITQLNISHQTKLMELEQQIQKQRERTLSLLEEKDKEIELFKTTFLSSLIKKKKTLSSSSPENSSTSLDQEAAASLLSNSLISSQKDGHILHYIQELARKDIEISNLRYARLQTETALRKLQQVSLLIEEKHNEEMEFLKSKVQLLENTKDQDGTNVEYLKNVVLRFLKCKDPNSQRHMINAIATVLHFTNSEVQEVKTYLK